MADRRYKWKRFWCPPTGRINLSDGDYLLDPDSDWGPDLNPDVVPFGSLADTPSLVLIGEPGMGKSVEMKGQCELLGQHVQASTDRVLRFDLRDYQTDLMLHQKVFAHPDLEDWAAGDHTVHLFLDSLDEGLLSVETLATLLPTELAAYRSHLHRLYFRIACRTAQWPRVLESSLRDLWGEDAVGVYELAPLRHIDVAEAAEVNGLVAEEFLYEVARRDAGPFASKPVTLDFLLRVYRKEGTFPQTRRELYERGCRLLCEEVNPSRVASRRIGQLTADQRLLIAGRLV